MNARRAQNVNLLVSNSYRCSCRVIFFHIHRSHTVSGCVTATTKSAASTVAATTTQQPTTTTEEVTTTEEPTTTQEATTTQEVTTTTTQQQPEFEFVQFPVGKSCVPKDGYMDVPISGKRDNVAVCQELCSKDIRCRSFTFFRNDHCSMFTHSCDSVKNSRDAISKKKVFV